MRSFALAGIAGLVLTGCAPHQYTKADVDGLVVCNPDAMDQVERAARRTFARVIWVRCPTATLRVT